MSGAHPTRHHARASARRWRSGWAILLIASALLTSGVGGQEAPPPAWAYPVMDPGFQRPPDDGRKHRVPGSASELTQTEINDPFNPPDWYPNEHPPMPPTVAHGRRPDVRACGQCHMPHGLGHPESSGLAGLSADYIEQQMIDYRAGRRKSAVPADIAASDIRRVHGQHDRPTPHRTDLRVDEGGGRIPPHQIQGQRESTSARTTGRRRLQPPPNREAPPRLKRGRGRRVRRGRGGARSCRRCPVLQLQQPARLGRERGTGFMLDVYAEDLELGAVLEIHHPQRPLPSAGRRGGLRLRSPRKLGGRRGPAAPDGGSRAGGRRSVSAGRVAPRGRPLPALALFRVGRTRRRHCAGRRCLKSTRAISPPCKSAVAFSACTTRRATPGSPSTVRCAVPLGECPHPSLAMNPDLLTYPSLDLAYHTLTYTCFTV